MHSIEPATVVLDIPAKTAYVAIVRQVVSIIAGRDERIDADRLADLALAVSEAATNAIESYHHISEEGAQAPTGPDRVSVTIVESDQSITVIVADTGSGFDPMAVPDHSLRADEHPAQGRRPSRTERGRGVPIIRLLADEVTFTSSSSGTSVTITMFFDAARRVPV